MKFLGGEGYVGRSFAALGRKPSAGWLLLCISVVAVGSAAAETKLKTLHRFAQQPVSPAAPLLLASDGNYYGVSQSGGLYGAGTVFCVTRSGELRTIHSFSRTGTAGSSPNRALAEGPDGMLYGSTQVGAAGELGAIFKITRDGVLVTLHSFSGPIGSVASPLAAGADGELYGTLFSDYSGSSSNPGTIFKISPAGVYTVVHQFTQTQSGAYPDGAKPSALTRGSDGALYGTTSWGGANRSGTLFKVSSGAGGFSTIRHFAEGEGFSSQLVKGEGATFYGTSLRYIASVTESGVYTPLHTYSGGGNGSGEYGGHALVYGRDGNLYGTTAYGGGNDYGTVFQMTPAGAYKVLHAFANGADGAIPRSGLTETSTGTLVGLTSEIRLNEPARLFEITPSGVFSTLFVFTRGNDGNKPAGELIQGADGSLYGVTFGGSTTASGTVFRLDRDGALTTLHEFISETDGSAPNGLCLGRDGNIYGTTTYGGPQGSGTIYRLSADGVFTVLRSFGGMDILDRPSSPLVEAGDGEFYGTLYGGNGAVFRITAAGEFSIVYKFSGSVDGAEPEAKLAWDGGETFYGTTSWKGPRGGGTIFKLTRSGQFETLYAFSGGADGGDARDLIIGKDGNLYGFTGDELGDYLSTIFRLSADGVFTTLHTFPKGSVAGTILQASDQQLYGVASGGKDVTYDEYGIPRGGKGFLFRLTTSGGLSSIHDFSGGSDGQHPSGLMQAADGQLYGTTTGEANGGGLGTIFQFSPSVTPAGKLLNISTRLRVSTGENVMIGGFIVTGDEPKKVLIRGIGPSLQGVQGPLADPTLELRNAAGQLVALNDNWQQSQAGEIHNTTIPPRSDLEAAIVRTLDPGAYTAIVSGRNSGTGIALVEAYDLDAAADSGLANISTRGFVESGDNVMIGGLILGSGSAHSEVLVRGIGPSLQQAGVKNALADPVLEVRDGNGMLLLANDDWQENAEQAARIAATGVPPQHPSEAAIIIALPPAPATAVLRGAVGGTGVGLVEVFNLAN